MAFYFAKKNSYRDVAEKFGIPTTTAFNSCVDVISQFVRLMTNRFIYLPEENEILEANFS